MNLDRGTFRIPGHRQRQYQRFLVRVKSLSAMKRHVVVSRTRVRSRSIRVELQEKMLPDECHESC